jgi:hypothetical protein
MKLDTPYTVQRYRNMLMEASLVVAMTMQRYRLLVPGQTIKAHLRGPCDYVRTCTAPL